MPVLDALPHISIIRGLKGILDFYYWKGIPCVRKWPVIPPSSRSPASMRSARLFGAIVAAYSLLGAVLKELFALDAADQTRTARDLFVSAVLGHLHDHNMSDFLDLLTQATAYLQILKDLPDALQSNAADRLLVRGQDQLFSYDDEIATLVEKVLTENNNYILSDAVLPGKIWIVTTAYAVDLDTALTEITISNRPIPDTVHLLQQIRAFPPGDGLSWAGMTIIKPGGRLRAKFWGSLLGDNTELHFTGYQMTLET